MPRTHNKQALSNICVTHNILLDNNMAETATKQMTTTLLQQWFL